MITAVAADAENAAAVAATAPDRAGLLIGWSFLTQAALLWFYCTSLRAFPQGGARACPPVDQQGVCLSEYACEGAWAHSRWWGMAGRRT
jgi:hypothetical protein